LFSQLRTSVSLTRYR